MKQIFIHIGPHKTGSKSLQLFLANNLDILQKKYYIPKNNIISKKYINHANLFWELSEPKDKRFNFKLGNYFSFLNEIKDCPKDILISSEAFSFIFTDKTLSKNICSDLKKLNFKINLIVFVRNDIYLFNSIYKQLIGTNKSNEYKKYSFIYIFFHLFFFGRIKNYMFNQIGNYYFYINHKLLIKNIKLIAPDITIKKINFNTDFIQNFLMNLNLDLKKSFPKKKIHENKSTKSLFLIIIGVFFYLKNLFSF